MKYRFFARNKNFLFLQKILKRQKTTLHTLYLFIFNLKLLMKEKKKSINEISDFLQKVKTFYFYKKFNLKF